VRSSEDLDHEDAPPPPSADDPRLRRAGAIAVVGLLLAVVGGGFFGAVGLGRLDPEFAGGAAAVLVAAVLLGIGFLLLLGGLGYYVFAPALRGRQAAMAGLGSHRLVLACTLLIVLVANAGPLAIAASQSSRGFCSVGGFVTAALSVDLALLAVTYLRFIRPGVITSADLGLRADRVIYDIGLGLLIGVGVLVLSAAIQAVLQAIGVRQTQLVDLQCIRGFSFSGFLAVTLAGGILAPIAEELYFRGFVFRGYLFTRGRLTAYAMTSLLFAVLHLNLPALLPILILSLVFCYAYERTGSIVPSVVAHALNNSAAFCILYFTNAQV
jgi:membrane protease YdiL (CAAX protease family)